MKAKEKVIWADEIATSALFRIDRIVQRIKENDILFSKSASFELCYCIKQLL